MALTQEEYDAWVQRWQSMRDLEESAPAWRVSRPVTWAEQDAGHDDFIVVHTAWLDNTKEEQMAITRKDYEEIAQELASMRWNFSRDKARWMAWVAALRVLASVFAWHNSTFNTYKFMATCGVWDEDGHIIKAWLKK